MDDVVELILQLGFAAVFILVQLVGRWMKKGEAERAPAPPPPPAEIDWPWDDEEEEVEPAAAPALAVDATASAREGFTEQVENLAERAGALRDSVRRDRASEHLGPVIHSAVVEPARQLGDTLRQGSGLPAPWEQEELAELEMRRAWLERFVLQRRDPRQRTALGDADALARACYQPLMGFAAANQVPLSSADVVTVLGPFELSTWTGFLPTGAAPIFLPPDFFSRIAWWPALAHEIGHDFLAATYEADESLRAQLGVASEAEGRRLLDPSGGSITTFDVYRLYGAWFEEMFCDVVGALMLGPAYGHTMVELFAQPGPAGASQVARARLDGTGLRYDVHPPRHLRVLWCARALELCGEEDEAAAIVAEWERLHGAIDSIAVPSTAGLLGIPVEPLRAMGAEIVERLYRDELEAYDGHPLGSIPGVDWGGHLAAEARRVRADFAAGHGTGIRDPRAIICGAVLAWREAPDSEAAILSRARSAIVGRSEWVDGADRPAHAPAAAAHEPLSPDWLREAFVLHTVLAPAPAVRRLRGRAGAPGILDRPV